MKTAFLALGAAMLISAVSTSAFAGQCRDPWVTRAVEQVTGHVPSGSYESGDCNIYNYGGGHWSSYPDLVNKVRAHFGIRTAGVCNDPWVTSAVRQVTGRVPNGSGNSGDCNIYRYGGGHWSSYSDLVNKVRVAFGDTILPGATGQIDLNRARGMNIRPGVNGAGVITAGGANVITAGGANVITAGGANMTAHGSGN